jgi:riboflavin kinase/FMN adenylyltransferase
MRIYRDLHVLPDHARGAAVAIGNFDGLHLGHRAVLTAAQETAHARGIPSAVLTFAPHPRRFFVPQTPPMALEPFHLRLRRLQALGVDIVYIARFNAPFSQQTAEEFLAQVLVAQLGVRHVVTGANFIFGHRRGGNAALLQDTASRYGFTYHAVDAQADAQQAYASSRVRQYLSAGAMAEAAAVLGRPYEIIGRVQHGQKRGRRLGYPTANIIPLSSQLLPAFGVYAVRYAVAEPLAPESAPVQWRPGVAYLGTRPTYAGEQPWLEVHALDTPEPLYGHRLRVQLLAHLRPDMSFATDEALQAQIAVDITKAKQVLEAPHA